MNRTQDCLNDKNVTGIFLKLINNADRDTKTNQKRKADWWIFNNIYCCTTIYANQNIPVINHCCS